jgi:iron complex outermembrane receptor protein
MGTKARQYKIFFSIIGIFCLIIGKPPAFADTENLGMLSLDQLLDVDVISVAKLPEKMTGTPAAVHVITGEDLRRSGIKSVPEALRMVPGMHVYRIDANKWAISARGFANRFSNKMLVMIDGRTVYTPLFSGVYWDVQDVMIDDIDRIEVICGPGGTLWGSNAVNGIINIITKDSADTQGSLVTFETGTRDRGTESARYGGWLDSKTSYRLYCKYFDRTALDTKSGDKAADAYHDGRTGFRADRNLDGGDKLTLEGNIYKGVETLLGFAHFFRCFI